MNDQEGNRLFSVAMIALENGDFAKSERLLRETIETMGPKHPVSLLSLKTLASIAQEQGRYEESLHLSLDLLDSQISTFGINHAEATRTIRGILDLCKELKDDNIAREVEAMVKTASDYDKNNTSQSLKRLRSDPNDLRRNKQGIKDKIATYLSRLFKK